MTRFRETEYHRAIEDAVRYELDYYGLEFVRADDPNWEVPMLWDRVRYCMEACHHGIAVFETIDETDINPNVSFELGYMMGISRPCLLLKEKRLTRLQSDLCGHLYREFDSRNSEETVGNQVHQWLQEIGARKREGEILIVFASIGGTCRCAIAKAITHQLLKDQKKGMRIRVESRGVQRPISGSATGSGRQAVKNVLGSDILATHRPQNAGVGFLNEADLILAMDDYVMDEISNIHLEYRGSIEQKKNVRDDINSKLFLVTQFFGSSVSNITDPYPDRGDEASLARYEDCTRNLQQLIEPNVDRLFDYLRTRRSIFR